MIQTEIVKYGDKELVRTYSDEGRYVVRDGISYNEAIDPPEMGRTYTEGDIIEYPAWINHSGSSNVNNEEIEELRDKAAAYDVLMGESE